MVSCSANIYSIFAFYLLHTYDSKRSGDQSRYSLRNGHILTGNKWGLLRSGNLTTTTTVMIVMLVTSAYHWLAVWMLCPNISGSLTIHSQYTCWSRENGESERDMFLDGTHMQWYTYSHILWWYGSIWYVDYDISQICHSSMSLLMYKYKRLATCITYLFSMNLWLAKDRTSACFSYKQLLC